MPTAAERLVWGFGDGSTMPVFETPLGRIGAVICWENYMPLLRMAMYAQGDRDLLRADGRRPRDVAVDDASHRARGALFRALLQPVHAPRRLPCRLPHAPTPDDVVSTGGSCIIDPLGEVLAGPARDGEKILSADLDLDEIVRGKFDLDVTGHYARPDVFRLIVDEAPKPPVSPAQ